MTEITSEELSKVKRMRREEILPSLAKERL